MRLALGVSRARLMRQALLESLLLSLLGSLAGLLVAHWGGAAIRATLVTTRGAALATFTDGRTVFAVAAFALLTAVLTGLAPALLSGRGDLVTSLKAGAREGTYRRSHARTALLVTQAALSVVLLIGAALFVPSLHNVRTLRMGYDAEPLLIVRPSWRGPVPDSAERVAIRRRLVATARAVPGVEAVAWVSSIPFWSTSTTSLYVAGIDSVSRLGRFRYQVATADFFAALGTRILRGRGFSEADREGTPRVAVVSASMARALWPAQDAIGQCLRIRDEQAPCTTVVGIAEDIVQEQDQLTDSRRFMYYLPLEQFSPAGGHSMVLRMHGNVAGHVEAVRRAVQAQLPADSFVTVRPLLEAVDGVHRSWRLGATLFVVFGFVALLVAAVGLNGMIAYNVTQRTHELGVRVALGARRPDILRLVLGESARVAFAGVVIGCTLALAASGWAQPLLFRQSSKDPAVYALVGAIMLVVAVFAAASPALRATRADPHAALRAE